MSQGDWSKQDADRLRALRGQRNLTTSEQMELVNLEVSYKDHLEDDSVPENEKIHPGTTATATATAAASSSAAKEKLGDQQQQKEKKKLSSSTSSSKKSGSRKKNSQNEEGEDDDSDGELIEAPTEAEEEAERERVLEAGAGAGGAGGGGGYFSSIASAVSSAVSSSAQPQQQQQQQNNNTSEQPQAAGTWKETIEQGAHEAYKKGFFWTSLVATAAPALGKKMGLTEGFDHWNFIIPYSKDNNHGPLILGALPVMTSVMGSGNHLQLLHQQLRDLNMTTKEPLVGMVVSALHKEEMEGFGSDLIKFATHQDWKNEFGPEIKTVLVPADDCTAGFFAVGEHKDAFAPLMNVLSEMNSVLESGRAVYAHCKAAKGRSWLVCMLFLIRYRNMTIDSASSLIKAARHQVNPSKEQVIFVEAFYKHLLASRQPAQNIMCSSETHTATTFEKI